MRNRNRRSSRSFRTSPGMTELIQALHQRFPDLTEHEAQQAAAQIVVVAVSGLSANSELALVSLDADGAIDLTVFGVSDDVRRWVKDVAVVFGQT